MVDPIEVCLGFFKGPTSPAEKTFKTFEEYIASLQGLTIMDAFLGIFLISLIVGFVLSFISPELALKCIQMSFLGIITFMTLKMTNQKFAADICMTCQGVNPMKYNRRIDVILSFIWVTAQTFIALILNVMYYFVVLYIAYVVMRSHLLYKFAATYKFAPERRILSKIHARFFLRDWRQLSRAGPLAIVFSLLGLIYTILFIVIAIGIIPVIALAVVKPEIITNLFKKSKAGLTALLWTTVPFVLIIISLIMNFLYHRLNTSWIDMLVARNILPAMSFTSMTSAFNFANAKILRVHAGVFLIAIVSGLLYSLVFLKPLSMTDICVGDNPKVNDDTPFMAFKNRFVTGHYIIGVLIIMSYIMLLGGSFGRTVVFATLGVFAILYFFVYLIMNLGGKKATQEDEAYEEE